MDLDAMRGLLAEATEREFITLILSALIAGVFTFALAWRIIGTGRDVQLRQLDSLDKAVARRGDETDDTEE